MMQEPNAWSVTVVPTTVHTEVDSEVKVTERPDEAVAEMPKGESSRVRPESAPNVIVWSPWPTVNECWTCAADVQLALPDWLASMVQRPTPWSVTVVPATVQTDVVSEVNTTARFEEAVAETVNGDSSRDRPERAPNVMD